MKTRISIVTVTSMVLSVAAVNIFGATTAASQDKAIGQDLEIALTASLITHAMNNLASATIYKVCSPFKSANNCKKTSCKPNTFPSSGCCCYNNLMYISNAPNTISNKILKNKMNHQLKALEYKLAQLKISKDVLNGLVLPKPSCAQMKTSFKYFLNSSYLPKPKKGSPKSCITLANGKQQCALTSSIKQYLSQLTPSC